VLLLEVSTRRAATWVRCDPESLIVIMDRTVEAIAFGRSLTFRNLARILHQFSGSTRELISTSDVIPHKGKIGHSFVSTTELLAPKSEKKHLEAGAALDYDLSL